MLRTTLYALTFLAVISSTAQAQEMWVAVDHLNRRACPSTSCGIVGKLFHRERVDVLEMRGDWARISEPYDASCGSGVSEYVDSGNAKCEASNGIVDGKFSEWVHAELLSEIKPPDPAEGATGSAALVRGSDDFRLYGPAFTAAAEKLIKRGRCTEGHFREMGGWVKSTNKVGPIYFTYCGDYRHVYLNAETGEVSE